MKVQTAALQNSQPKTHSVIVTGRLAGFKDSAVNWLLLGWYREDWRARSGDQLLCTSVLLNAVGMQGLSDLLRDGCRRSC